MTDIWDGRPQNPERDGWHWVQWVGLFPADQADAPTVRKWEKDGWWDGSMHRHARYWQQGWRYVAPCLTPVEVDALTAERDDWVEQARKAMEDADARVAAARREGIEACMAIARERGAWASNDADADNLKDRLEANGRMDMAAEIAAAIRALLEDGR